MLYCFFGVIHQISRSHGLKNRRFKSNLSKITRPVAAIKSLRFALLFLWIQFSAAWWELVQDRRNSIAKALFLALTHRYQPEWYCDEDSSSWTYHTHGHSRISWHAILRLQSKMKCYSQPRVNLATTLRFLELVCDQVWSTHRLTTWARP